MAAAAAAFGHQRVFGAAPHARPFAGVMRGGDPAWHDGEGWRQLPIRQKKTGCAERESTPGQFNPAKGGMPDWRRAVAAGVEGDSLPLRDDDCILPCTFRQKGGVAMGGAICRMDGRRVPPEPGIRLSV